MKYVKLDSNNIVIKEVLGSMPYGEYMTVDETVYPQDLTGYTYEDPIFVMRDIEIYREAVHGDFIAYADRVNVNLYDSFADFSSDPSGQKARESWIVDADINTPLVDTPYLTRMASDDMTVRNTLAAEFVLMSHEYADADIYSKNKLKLIKTATTIAELDAITWGDGTTEPDIFGRHR